MTIHKKGINMIQEKKVVQESQITGGSIKDIVFKNEFVTQELRVIPRDKNIYVQLAERDAHFGKVMMPTNAAQLTRFAKVMAIGPGVTKWKVGEVVAVAYITGTELYAPAFGFYSQDTHKILPEDGVLFKVEDKVQEE